MALTLAVLSSVFFGVALVTAKVGLRHLDARAGAALGIPAAAVLFCAVAPFVIELDRFNVEAMLLFVAVGLFFPALVTLLTFRSNAELGPTVTSAVSGTAPLFALLGAGIFLGEPVPAQATLASLGVVAGVGLLSWKRGALRPGAAAGALVWPVSGAVVRGLAQVVAKAGLLLWPSPFVAGLIGYLVSSAVVVSANRFVRSTRPPLTKQGALWFVVTGILNGSAVLLLYAALSLAPVALVAPVAATYPLATMVLGAAFLREEKVTLRAVAGALTTVAAIVYLVA